MLNRKFKDYNLSVRLRMQICNIVAPFANHDQIFTPVELRTLLVQVFQLKEYEVSYELLKILFYGKQKYQHVRLQELINYIAEKHLGDNAVNCYTLRKGYLCKEDKIMTKSQFISTIEIGLEFLQGRDREKDNIEFNKLFDEIDRKGLGTITHSDYFDFLRDYLGSESTMAVNSTLKVDTVTESREVISPRKEEGEDVPFKTPLGQIFESKYFSQTSKYEIKSGEPLEQLKELIISEIGERFSEFDSNRDGHLTRDQSSDFFFRILELEANSVQYILENYFDFREKETVQKAQFIEVVCEVHFREIFSMLLKQELKIQNPSQCFLDIQLFIKKVRENCYFFNKKPTDELLKAVFLELQIRSQLKQAGLITLQDFRSYVLTSLCNNHLIFRKNFKKSTHIAMPSIPLSIAEVQNSNFQEDSQYNQIRPRQFSSSICQPYNQQRLFAVQVEAPDADCSITSNREDIRYDPGPRKSATTQDTKQATFKQVSSENSTEFSPQAVISPQLLGFANITRKKHSVLRKEKMNLKELLWSVLSKKVEKYCKTRIGSLSEREALLLLQEQAFFGQVSPDFKDMLFKYFNKSQEMSYKLLINYAIHRRGELALINFNKLQIKGKSTLQQEEAIQLMLSAYGMIPSITQQLCRQYIFQGKEESRNGQLSYRGYLSMVGRILTESLYF